MVHCSLVVSLLLIRLFYMLDCLLLSLVCLSSLLVILFEATFLLLLCIVSVKQPGNPVIFTVVLQRE